ncbi:MAG: hypothetical protein WAL61_08080 [Acidimicrobiales bacterium]
MSATESTATGILVRTKIFPLAFLLLLFKTNVTIDGATSVLRWGDHFFTVPPGAHDVRVSFRYLFSSDMGKASLSVDVVPGRTTTVLYRSPFLVFLGGSMKVVGS